MKDTQKKQSYESRSDTLFYGYRFGMTRQEFFDHSWNLNKEGVVRNGSGAEIRSYTDKLKSPASMSFYPVFSEDRIIALPVVYMYDGWAPWNNHLTADSLLQDLLYLYSDSLNIDFEVVEQDTVPETYYVQQINNQEIRMFKLTDSKVMVDFADLSKIEIQE